MTQYDFSYLDKEETQILKNTKKALSLFSVFNTEEETQRLNYITNLLKQRRRVK